MWIPKGMVEWNSVPQNEILIYRGQTSMEESTYKEQCGAKK